MLIASLASIPLAIVDASVKPILRQKDLSLLELFSLSLLHHTIMSWKHGHEQNTDT